MARKAHTFTPENQSVWETFANFKRAESLAHQIELGKVSNKEKVEVTISQYRSSAAKLDKVCPNWVNLTAEIVEKVKTENPDNSSLINSFLVDVIGEEFLAVKAYRPLILTLMPKNFQKIAKKLPRN